MVIGALSLYTPSPVCSTVRTAFLYYSFYKGFIRPPRPKWRPVRSLHNSPSLTFFFHKKLLIRSFFLSPVVISSNQVTKNRRNVAPLLTKRRIANAKFILTFRIIIPVKYSRYRHLNLLDCKVASKSKLYGHCVAAGGTVYLSYNVHGNDLSVLYRVLDEKKRLNVKERKTTLLLYNTAFKLLHLKD